MPYALSMASPAASPSAASKVTLAISGFHRHGASALRRMLLDWFAFIGERPGEVVYVDGGSPPATTRRLVAMLHEGLIDRLELLNPVHWENSYDRCYIQEYRAGRLATRPYVMFAKLDMLTFRRGYSDWLAEDLRALDRDDVFAITNSHLVEPASGRDGPYLTYDFASLNYSLMKRSRWDEAVQEQMGELIASGFRGEYPAHIDVDPRWRRALVEWAWQAHCRRHGYRTLARAESRDWMIYHVNKSGRKLLWLRRRFLAGDGVEAFFDQPKMLYRPPHRPLQRLGRSIEEVARRIRGGITGSASATKH